jgi:nucleotide-binding universal stress UspA family protein
LSDAAGQPLLVCYDGSEGGRAALEAAARGFCGHDAIVVTYWQPFAASERRFAMEILELVQNRDDINAREEQLAVEIAEEGAAVAREAGLSVTVRTSRIEGPISDAILADAEEADAAAIVLGSRSRNRFRSIILGSVANEVVQRAARPVFLAPSEDLARERRDQITGGVSAGR